MRDDGKTDGRARTAKSKDTVSVAAAAESSVPKNQLGRPPQRRIPQAVSAKSVAIPQHGTEPEIEPVSSKQIDDSAKTAVTRTPLLRPKSSLQAAREHQLLRRRTYEDLQLRPQRGLSPHEILLKIATLTLGKSLLAQLMAGAERQQVAMQRATHRLSHRQGVLLGLLEPSMAQTLSSALSVSIPNEETESAKKPERSSGTPRSRMSTNTQTSPSEAVERGNSAGPSSSLKIRY